MKLSIGISPCPNDSFIFYGLLNGLIETRGYEFELILADVEELNSRARDNVLDITKISFHAHAHLTQHYQLLNAGSALGEGCGPLLISKDHFSPEEIPSKKIAIPGKYTTANLLLSLAFPSANKKEEMIFSAIENNVLEGDCDIGLIIHENRFTYEAKGLVKLMDLGEYWEELTKQPIPLGGIAIKRDLAADQKKEVDQMIFESIQYAYANENETLAYASRFAQEMDKEVMKQHIDLYVNDYSSDLGERGRKMIVNLYEMMLGNDMIDRIYQPIFAV